MELISKKISRSLSLKGTLKIGRGEIGREKGARGGIEEAAEAGVVIEGREGREEAGIEEREARGIMVTAIEEETEIITSPKKRRSMLTKSQDRPPTIKYKSSKKLSKKKKVHMPSFRTLHQAGSRKSWRRTRQLPQQAQG